MREKFLYVIKMQSVLILYVWFHFLFSTFFFDFRENVKINSLNTLFAQRRKADVGYNLVVLSIRMFHYCSLLLDFEKKFGTGVR